MHKNIAYSASITVLQIESLLQYQQLQAATCTSLPLPCTIIIIIHNSYYYQTPPWTCYAALGRGM